MSSERAYSGSKPREGLLTDTEGRVTSFKVADFVSKVLILLLSVLAGILASALNSATTERNEMRKEFHAQISEFRKEASADRTAILSTISLCETRLSVIEGSRWTVADHAGHEREEATRFEKIWERVIALESRPFPETPPAWFKAQVDNLGDKVDANTKLIIAVQTRIETLAEQEKKERNK